MSWQTHELPTGRLGVLESADNDVPLSELCHFGARNNPKRGFLFVSTVLGKHLPADPARMHAMHRLLARKIQSDADAPVLFIGMAETGIALAYGVYEAWVELNASENSLGDGRAIFMHSTRYLIDGLPTLDFEEGHSHAPSQWLHHLAAPAMREAARRARTLVMLDDEVSTGKTFLNLWRAIAPLYPAIERINIVTLTDFMGETRRTALDAELGRPTTHVSAARAEWRFESRPWQAPNHPAPPPYHDPKLKPLPHLGRGGIDRPLSLPPELLARVERLLEQARRGAGLRAIRVIGTGEFMHAPYRLARWLEQVGVPVTLQSSTRSPILEFGPILSTHRLDDPYGRGDPYFIYNAPRAEAPDDGELALILHETAANPAIRRFAELIGAHALPWESAT